MNLSEYNYYYTTNNNTMKDELLQELQKLEKDLVALSLFSTDDNERSAMMRNYTTVRKTIKYITNN
ncbi:MAG: hypothetical protein Unbinned2716contig1001_36 [Prokaryotic dsDNA virus sp.]|nr:MAG: hypothetical protein Unbinned2716contig1001_36 [Prokaryotic dsDNA virus sp.]